MANYSNPRINCKDMKTSQADLKVESVGEARRTCDLEVSTSNNPVNHAIAGVSNAKEEIDGINCACPLKSPTTSSASNSLVYFSQFWRRKKSGQSLP